MRHRPVASQPPRKRRAPVRLQELYQVDPQARAGAGLDQVTRSGDRLQGCAIDGHALDGLLAIAEPHVPVIHGFGGSHGSPTPASDACASRIASSNSRFAKWCASSCPNREAPNGQDAVEVATPELPASTDCPA